MKKEGYLVEAHLSVEESFLNRGSQLTYWYGVKQRRKELSGTATRYREIPLDRNIKGKCLHLIWDHLFYMVGFSLLTNSPVFYPELHLYEGFICCYDQSLLRKGLHMVGLSGSEGVKLSDAWQTSAAALLDRIFQKWTPSDKQSTESLCQHLVYFTWSLISAHTRIRYDDRSNPPMIKVCSVWSVKTCSFICFTSATPPIMNVCIYRHWSWFQRVWFRS